MRPRGLTRSIVCNPIKVETYRPVPGGPVCPAWLTCGAGLVGYPGTAYRRRSPGQQASCYKIERIKEDQSD